MSEGKDQALIMAFYAEPAAATRRQLPAWMNDQIDAGVTDIIRRFAPEAFLDGSTITDGESLFAALADLPEARARACGLEMADAIRKVLADNGTTIVGTSS